MENEKNIGIIAYLSFVGTILAYFFNLEKKSEFVFFHIRQMLGLLVMYLVSDIVYTINQMISYGLWALVFVCWLIGIVGAIQYKKQEIPIVGAYFQKLFKTIG